MTYIKSYCSNNFFLIYTQKVKLILYSIVNKVTLYWISCQNSRNKRAYYICGTDVWLERVL